MRKFIKASVFFFLFSDVFLLMMLAQSDGFFQQMPENLVLNPKSLHGGDTTSPLWYFFASKEKTNVAENKKVTTNTPPPQSAKPETPPIKTKPLQPEAELLQGNFDQTAQALAGISPHFGLDSSKTWKGFAAQFDASWQTAENRRFMKMYDWAITELPNNRLDVFYPFSGPDFVHAFYFFPKAKNYYLFGLEPIGNLPHLEKMKKQDTEKYFDDINASLSNFFANSYFITKKMMTDLSQQEVNGVLPLMCIFLARTGNRIVDVSRVEIDAIGTLKMAQNNGIGVKIRFWDTATGEEKNLYYFKKNVADGSLNNTPFLKFLQQLPPVNTYFKSASYLMHYESFSILRRLVFEKSNHILQDDTGIAFRYFKTNEWNIRLFGTYSEPVKPFGKKNEQTDLRTQYDSIKTSALPFDIGYHARAKHNNLMLASKNKP